jgi:Xaa-Pro aminopeptidase
VKQDIDRLMAERELDAIVVLGPDGLGSANAAWRYITGSPDLVGTVVQRRGAAPQLIYHRMERQQAEESGLDLVPFDRWDWPAMLKQHPKRIDAITEWYRQVFRDLDIGGRVAFYGVARAHELLALAEALPRAIPGLQLVGEYEHDLIGEARDTKDTDEIERMADVGRRTCAVVQGLVDYIKAQRLRDGVVVDSAGSVVTIGAIHALIRQLLDQHNLDAPDGTIFSQGRDAAVPHATGTLDDPLRAGAAIIIDIFPRDRATGYYHDMTRTFAIDHAPPDLQRGYDDVKAAFDAVIRDLRVGERTLHYQQLACQVLRERGHKTTDDEWPLEEGYVHGLGHGIGLDVHEPLLFSTLSDRGDVIKPGAVFTIEPGVYYPSREIGVRIEDTIACEPDGTFRSLTPFPYDLVIPIGA